MSEAALAVAVVPSFMWHESPQQPFLAADAEGKLKGMLSMNDIVLKAKKRNGKKSPELSYEDVVKTFKVICEHPLPTSKAAAAQGTE